MGCGSGRWSTAAGKAAIALAGGLWRQAAASGPTPYAIEEREQAALMNALKLTHTPSLGSAHEHTTFAGLLVDSFPGATPRQVHPCANCLRRDILC